MGGMGDTAVEGDNVDDCPLTPQLPLNPAQASVRW